MTLEIVRKGNVITRLTVNKERITIKLAEKDDSQEVIDFLTTVAHQIQADPTIKVTLRGVLEEHNIQMFDDLRAFNKNIVRK